MVIGNLEGARYIVKELLEGEELRAQMNSGPLPSRNAVDYAQQIDAHRRKLGWVLPTNELILDKSFVTYNRVGGSLTAPVLPHHRTCGSASGGSR
jgi:hypothetical protein